MSTANGRSKLKFLRHKRHLLSRFRPTRYSNYEVALKVPLIVYDPKFPQANANRIDAITELIDLFPTLVDIAGLPALNKCSNAIDYEDESITCTEGKSLHKLMQSEQLVENSEEEAFSQYPRPGPIPTKSPDSDQPKLQEIKIMGYSIRTRQFRYTAWIKFNNKKFKRSEINLDIQRRSLLIRFSQSRLAKNPRRRIVRSHFGWR